MAMSYGDAVARKVIQGDVAVPSGSWVPLTASGVSGVTTGTTPLQSRRHLRFQIKAAPGGALALQYVAKNLDGTFTTPTQSGLIKISTVYAGQTIEVEPIGDSIQVFGRLSKKKGFTGDSIRVIVTEYA